MDDETTKQLKKLWEDNAYPSLTPLYKLARKRDLPVKIKDVEAWLKNRASTSLLQQRKEPYAVAGTFDNATKPLERVYLDLWDRSTHPSPDGYRYIMIALDSFTRKAWAEPMKNKLPDAFMKAYIAIEKQLGGKPVLLFTDKEGATTKLNKKNNSAGSDSVFAAHLEKHSVILKRKVGRNDLAVIDAFMGMLGRTVSKLRMERNLPESAWKVLAMEALPILNDRSMKRLDGSSPNDVQGSIDSTDPKEKVLAYRVLKANAEGLETNHDEHVSIVKKVEAAGGFRVPTTFRAGRAHGMTKIGEKSSTVKWESKIRVLKDGKVHMGMAIDQITNEEFPVKLVQAVKVSADMPGERGTEKTISVKRREKYREAFQPFVVPVKKYLRENGRVTFTELGTFLGQVEGVPMRWGPDLKRATQLTSRSMIIPFLESFPEFKIEIENKIHHALLATPASSSARGSTEAERIEEPAEKKEVKPAKTVRSARAVGVKRAPPKVIMMRRAVPARAVKRAPPKISGVRRGPVRRAAVK